MSDSILENKTANNVYTRFHRVAIGDQNQISTGNDLTTCKMTASVKTGATPTETNSCGAMIINEEDMQTADGLAVIEDGEEYDLVLYKGKGSFLLSGQTIIIDGDAEVDFFTGSPLYDHVVTYTGDFSIEIEVGVDT